MIDYNNHPENPTRSNLVAHALCELDRIGETSHDPPSMRDWVLELVRTFSEQGHSGSSAMWAIAVIDKLLRFQPLSPLTSHPDEWFQHEDNLWQSRRDGECFSTDGGKTYTRVGEKSIVYPTKVVT